MSKYEFLGDNLKKVNSTKDEIIKLEMAYQLKRIADSLEDLTTTIDLKGD